MLVWYLQQAHIPPKLYNSRPNAIKAAKLSIEAKVPSGILQRANKVWRLRHPGEMYGGHTNQLFGRIVCTANGALFFVLEKNDKVGGPIPVIATGDNPIGNNIYTEQTADPNVGICSIP